MKRTYQKPEITKYVSVTDITEWHFSQHGSNVSEGANRTVAVDDCADAKDTIIIDVFQEQYCLDPT